MFNSIIGCEAANDITNILSNNAKIQFQILGLGENKLTIVKADKGGLQNTSNLK